MKIRYNGTPGCFCDTEKRDRWEPGEMRDIDAEYAARLLGTGFFNVFQDEEKDEKDLPQADNKMASAPKRK